MFLFVLLKTIVCLFLANASSSSAADDVTACRDVCDVIGRLHSPATCLLRCAELEAKNGIPPSSDLLPLLLRDPASPYGAISRAERAGRGSSNQMANNFVRYGRDGSSQARRPVYIRVGRSSVGWWSDPELQEDSKRASRFVRIGKSGMIGQQGPWDPSELADLEKRNYIQPSKYVRIGRNGEDETASTD